MRSPIGNHELAQLDGNADDLWTRGDDWVKLGMVMDSTATALTDIADSDVCKSQGTENSRSSPATAPPTSPRLPSATRTRAGRCAPTPTRSTPRRAGSAPTRIPSSRPSARTTALSTPSTYDGALTWAADLTEDVFAGREVSGEVRAAFASTAMERALMPSPFPEAIERYWRRPDTGAPDRLAHLYAIETVDGTAEELVELAGTGPGGRVQTVTVLEDTPLAVALHVVIVLEIADSTVAVARLIGAREGTALMLELIDDDMAAFAALQDDLDALFRSIRIRAV